MKSEILITLLGVIFLSGHTSAQTQTERHNFPFAVGLFSANIRCTGSLISRRAILTVNDCLPAPITDVTLGASDLSNRNEQTQVRFSVGEETYRRDTATPLAIIRFFPQIAFFTETVNVVTIPFQTPNEHFENIPATVLGFLNQQQTTDPLLSWNVNTVTNSDCRQRWISNLTADEICTFGTLGCTLALGSPLVVRNAQGWTMIGIQFRFNNCNSHIHARSTYLRLTSSFAFIRTHM